MIYCISAKSVSRHVLRVCNMTLARMVICLPVEVSLGDDFLLLLNVPI